ncbi:MAG: VCBS repeat-containing protein, partial [Bacteroidota bacterium]
MKSIISILFLVASISLSGQTIFGEQQILDISDPLTESTPVRPFDINQDGFTDFVLNASTGLFIIINNTDGTFNKRRLTTAKVETETILDWDEDGDLDILTGLDTMVVWLEQLPTGEFSEPQALSDQKTPFTAIGVADIDEDGDLDFYEHIGGTGPAYMNWLEQLDGQGSFSAPQSLFNFSTMIVGRLEVTYEDFDNDGIKDFMVKRSDFANFWSFAKGLGNGNFSTPINIGDPDNGVFGLNFPGYYDLDQDGDLDIIAVEDNEHQPDLLWRYERTDNGFADATPIPVELVENGDTDRVILADLNNDDILDLVAEAFPEQHFVSTGVQSGGIGFENTSFLTLPDDIDINALSLSAVTDVDGDNDLDIVYQYLSGCDRITIQMYWAENIDGQGTFSDLEYLINQPSPEFNALETYTIDLFNDGTKYLIPYRFNNRLVAYPYQENTPHFNTTPVILYDALPPRALCIADVDGDQDDDIIVGKDGQLAWYENLLDFNVFSEKRIINDITGIIVDVIADDWNGDGFIDLAFVEGSNVYWHENLDGLGNFSEVNRLTECNISSKNVISLDIDKIG